MFFRNYLSMTGILFRFQRLSFMAKNTNEIEYFHEETVISKQMSQIYICFEKLKKNSYNFEKVAY